MSISKGIKEYEKEFVIIHPEIERFYQVFYENIVVTKGGVSFLFKNGLHEINSFEQYYELLWCALGRIKENYEDPNRTIPFVAFSTISSGYDSTAVTCLAKKLGANTCFTVKKTISLRRWSKKHCTDDGTLAAQALNLNVVYADASPTNMTEDEPFFLSTNYGESETSPVLNEIALASVAAYIEQHCSAAVLFTGYHGDKLWDIHTPEEFLGEELMQSFGANFGLSEIRLKSGFINIAVPFILARNIRSIVAISRSDEMKPWSLHNDYDRPIARRISESSGLSREWFGILKKYVACHYYRLPRSHTLRKLFIKHLQKHYGLKPWFIYTNHALNQTTSIFQRVVLRRQYGTKQKPLRLSTFWPTLDIGFLLWIWATHILSKRASEAFKRCVKAVDEEQQI
jgi:hypothetical protein